MKIPKQLQKEDFNFIYLEGKNPAINGKDWNKQRHTYFEADALLEKGLNYGVMCGHGGLIIIDADSTSVAETVEALLPETFTVQTGSGKKHFYYICPEIDKKIIFDDKIVPSRLKEGEDHYGEVITWGFQAVGPGSVHPDSKKHYLVIKDSNIAKVSKERILSALAPFLREKDIPETKFNPPPLPSGFGEPKGKIDISTLRLENILPIKRTCVIKHPIHGATGEGNLSLDIEKQVWHCFRCESGGGPMSLVAVMEGIIECGDAVKKGLTGDLFIKTADLAIEKYGAKREIQLKPILPSYPKETIDVIRGPIRLSELILPVYNNDWVWEGYIARRKITLLFATWKSGKSTFYNHLLRNIEKGEEFLGVKTNFTETFVVSEEDLSEWVQRRDLYKFGKHTIIDSQPFVGRPTQEQWEAYLIEKGEYCLQNKIDTVVIDTIANLWPVDNENDASKVSTGLIPLRELTKRGLAVLLIHHPKKEFSDIDTAMRGSGAIPSFVDAYMMMSRVQQGNEFQRKLEIRGRSGFSTEKIVIELRDHKKTTEKYVRLGTTGEVSDGNSREIVMNVLRTCPYPLSVKEVREESNLLLDEEDGMKKLSERHIQRILKELSEEKIIEIESGGFSNKGRVPDKYKLKEKQDDLGI